MFGSPPLFRDRTAAGRRLAAALVSPGVVLDRPAVFALPRGGVQVAAPVAEALGAPLDVVLVRKLGAPGQPELALGALVDGAEPWTVINEGVRAATGADDAYIARARDQALREIDERRRLYRGHRAAVDPAGRTAIVIDDGLATGATARAAIHALRAAGAARVILAVPVAPPEAVAELRREVDEVYCLATPDRFRGVGAFYEDFTQVRDDEVIALLDEAARRSRMMKDD